jgi:hypothetical protein
MTHGEGRAGREYQTGGNEESDTVGWIVRQSDRERHRADDPGAQRGAGQEIAPARQPAISHASGHEDRRVNERQEAGGGVTERVVENDECDEHRRNRYEP